MQSFYRGLLRRKTLNASIVSHFKSTSAHTNSSSHGLTTDPSSVLSLNNQLLLRSYHLLASRSPVPPEKLTPLIGGNHGSLMGSSLLNRSLTTAGESSGASDPTVSEVAPRIKFKRLDKTAKHIMQILDKEAVEEVKSTREIPDIKPGYRVELKVVVPENKRRVSTVKGIVIARRNAGLNTTFRLRRQDIGVEYLFPLYSPNIKEIKVLEKFKVRRAKLYYLRDKMKALKKRK
ncbi:hypothetical protein Tsubulata_016779 [Turnera subulata]|uniref:Ribosomal protein L19 n=1 Tax=Turnera subulata TaxID=218843 RepID=A0A9Q0F934_9ROSI|nr:hypothetical protein Tsubulata_016779 [Turnera subulata]